MGELLFVLFYGGIVIGLSFFVSKFIHSLTDERVEVKEEKSSNVQLHEQKGLL